MSRLDERLPWAYVKTNAGQLSGLRTSLTIYHHFHDNLDAFAAKVAVFWSICAGWDFPFEKSAPSILAMPSPSIVPGLATDRIRDEAEYGGLRIKTTADVDGAKVRVVIDIGVGNSIEPELVEIDLPVLLEQPAPPPAGLSLWDGDRREVSGNGGARAR